MLNTQPQDDVKITDLPKDFVGKVKFILLGDEDTFDKETTLYYWLY